jgi:hypothetical protein
MDRQQLEKERNECLKELCGLSGWALGTLVETKRKQGGKMKPFRYLSRSVKGKNRITYISKAQMQPLRQALQTGRRAKELMEQIADLTVALVKAPVSEKE